MLFLDFNCQSPLKVHFRKPHQLGVKVQPWYNLSFSQKFANNIIIYWKVLKSEVNYQL